MSKTVKIILFLVLAIAVVVIGIPMASGFLSTFNPSKAVQMAKEKAQENGETVSFVGIWQANGGMSSGWSDRYNFYPSGTYTFYPNEMECLNQKIVKIGSWKFENNLLTLTTKKQKISNFICSGDGESKLVSSEEVIIKKPNMEQFSVINNGIQEEDVYQSITLNGTQFWKFSEDPTRYNEDNEFPEPTSP